MFYTNKKETLNIKLLGKLYIIFMCIRKKKKSNWNFRKYHNIFFRLNLILSVLKVWRFVESKNIVKTHIDYYIHIFERMYDLNEGHLLHLKLIIVQIASCLKKNKIWEEKKNYKYTILFYI